MKAHLNECFEQAVAALRVDGTLPAEGPGFAVERTRDPSHGDFACNVAMVMARPAGVKPRDLAGLVVERLPESPHVERVEIAGPGFINVFLGAAAYREVVRAVHEAGEAYGHSTVGAGRRVQVEFVSANPTGPLHVGHGRGAAYGAAVADLLAATGFRVHREYYVNDAGRQMDILAASVWLRYLELHGERVRFPDNGYRGDYVLDIARGLHAEVGNTLVQPAARVSDGLPPDAEQGGDKEAHIDALVERARELLGEGGYDQVFRAGLDGILADIREDLEAFGVVHDHWFSERGLTETGAVDRALDRLRDAGHLYEAEGATWFRSSAFGDTKDRVVIRENGQRTYFASDIAYHMAKLDAGYDWVIDVWGADHHGYVPRVRAALEAMGEPVERLDVLLVQFAVLWRHGEKVPMSTRAGEFVTLRELREEVGNDAARFFYVMRRGEQHLDFDLDLAKSRSSENPVYYIQYAHARVCSLLGQLDERGWSHDIERGLANMDQLTADHEVALMSSLGRFPEVIELAALSHEPHQVGHYLRELANEFHTWYNAHPILVEDDALRDARLALALAVRRIIRNGLGILGVNAPESM
ncbi:MAG: arginine--tRNA ligase [Pseudomonadota bacterium]